MDQKTSGSTGRQILNSINRREFVAGAAVVTAGICLCCGTCAEAATPINEAAATSQPTTLDAGPLSNYSTDGFTTTWAASPNRVLLVRSNGKIWAMSSSCTHHGCVVKPNAANLLCPCHHASFGPDGTVQRGPAKVALNHYGISVSDAGNVLVDKTVRFEQGHFADNGAMIDAPKKG